MFSTTWDNAACGYNGRDTLYDLEGFSILRQHDGRRTPAARTYTLHMPGAVFACRYRLHIDAPRYLFARPFCSCLARTINWFFCLLPHAAVYTATTLPRTWRTLHITLTFCRGDGWTLHCWVGHERIKRGMAPCDVRAYRLAIARH